MALIEVKVPDIGDFADVSVIELLVKVGDSVRAEQSLITVESDKASMEIPCSSSGVVKELKVKLGDKVKQGSVVLMLEEHTSVAPESVANSASPKQSLSTPALVSTAPSLSIGPIQVLVPDIGDFKDVSVIELLVKPGDSVEVDQSLITIESDKASMEIPSSAKGIIKELKVKIGDKVNIGDLLAIVEGSSNISSKVTSSTSSGPISAEQTNAQRLSVQHLSGQEPGSASNPGIATAAKAPSEVPTHTPSSPLSASTEVPHASPSVRKFARELGVPLEEITGTGLKGRITHEDVQSFTRRVMQGLSTSQTQKGQSGAASGPGSSALGLLPWPVVDFAKFGPIERKPMSRIKKISGANLHRNWVMIPHVTNHDDADITELEAFRVLTNKENEKSGVKVTMLAFLIKACVACLKKYPEFNSSLDGDDLVYKSYYNIGFAADTPNGLVVPVIKSADTKGVLQISKEMGELAAKAREGKLSPAEMSGATFTISSLGGIGGRYFNPIINAPEVSILGVCKSSMQPVWNGREFTPRLILPLSLSWDHRVIDGAAAARFNAYLGQILSDFRRVLL
jgi:pyruvate dehydrogenase E2 component (dihydrolipoamide acetyltransferase)